jgi:hypothetical protein
MAKKQKRQPIHQMPENWVTHKEFVKTDDKFRKACENAGVEPTARQASKFRSGRGAAYNAR